MKLSFLIFGFQQFVEAQFPGRYAHEMVNLHRELKSGTVLNTSQSNIEFQSVFSSHDLIRVRHTSGIIAPLGKSGQSYVGYFRMGTF